MPANVSLVDAVARGVLGAVALVVAALLNHLPGVSLLLAVVALVLFGTALTRMCPLYRLLGISTCPRRG